MALVRQISRPCYTAAAFKSQKLDEKHSSQLHFEFSPFSHRLNEKSILVWKLPIDDIIVSNFTIGILAYESFTKLISNCPKNHAFPQDLKKDSIIFLVIFSLLLIY